MTRDVSRWFRILNPKPDVNWFKPKDNTYQGKCTYWADMVVRAQWKISTQTRVKGQLEIRSYLNILLWKKSQWKQLSSSVRIKDRILITVWNWTFLRFVLHTYDNFSWLFFSKSCGCEGIMLFAWLTKVSLRRCRPRVTVTSGPRLALCATYEGPKTCKKHLVIIMLFVISTVLCFNVTPIIPVSNIMIFKDFLRIFIN